MGAGVFVGEPARPNQEFEPTRSASLRAGFSAAQEIAFAHNADEKTMLVDHGQSAAVR